MIDPYQWLLRAPYLNLEFAPLPHDEMGRWIPAANTIVLDSSLNQVERRCTLMHELIHRLHQDSPHAPQYLVERQERDCRRRTAKLLITLPDLLDALLWSYGEHEEEMAEQLWVDVETLRDRLDNLSDQERVYLMRRIQKTRERAA